MPDAPAAAPPVSPPVSPTSPAALPTGAAALGTVPLGFSNVPTSKAFTRAREGLKSGKYDAPSADKPAIAPERTRQDEPPKETKVEPDKPQDAPPTEQTTEKPTDKPTEEKKKVSPWRLVDEWKDKASRLEKELTELKTKPQTEDPEIAKKLTASDERITALEKENTELKQRVKFADYAESEEYKEKFEKPYTDAWAAGRKMIARLQVTQPDGTTRQAAAADFDALMESYLRSPEQTAETIESLFGQRASLLTPYLVDVEKQASRAQNALDEFKKTGHQQRQQQQEAQQRFQKQMADHLTQSWEKANKLAVEDPKNGSYFKPRAKEAADFDPEWNQRLAKGFELADRAFRENPYDPRLTPEQREAVVQRHAAVRNRAAAFGALKYENAKLRSQLEEREKALEQYEESEPTAGDGKGKETTQTTAGSALERSRAALRSGKYAR
jgi:hypothetical protein